MLMSESERPPARTGIRGPRIVAAVIAAICLMVGLSYLLTGYQNGDYFSFILGLFVFSLFFSFMSAAWRVPIHNPVFRTVTVTKCSKCEYTEVRDFQRGDYVYKNLGKCKDCEGEMYIKSIYTVPVQKTQLSPA
jgi:hypothetical protein